MLNRSPLELIEGSCSWAYIRKEKINPKLVDLQISDRWAGLKPRKEMCSCLHSSSLGDKWFHRNYFSTLLKNNFKISTLKEFQLPFSFPLHAFCTSKLSFPVACKHLLCSSSKTKLILFQPALPHQVLLMLPILSVHFSDSFTVWPTLLFQQPSSPPLKCFSTDHLSPANTVSSECPFVQHKFKVTVSETVSNSFQRWSSKSFVNITSFPVPFLFVIYCNNLSTGQWPPHRWDQQW